MKIRQTRGLVSQFRNQSSRGKDSPKPRQSRKDPAPDLQSALSSVALAEEEIRNPQLAAP
jgi:hypothetical protein